MPERVTFQYTATRTTFRDSTEPNLEAAGVVPDIRVPVTLETVAAFRNGDDPVMDAAFDVIVRLADPRLKLPANPWVWTQAATIDLEVVDIDEPERYSITFAEDGTYTMTADCNEVIGAWSLEDSQLTLTLTPGPATLALCPEPSKGETFVRMLTASNSIDFRGNGFTMLVKDDAYSVLQFEAAKGADSYNRRMHLRGPD